MHKVVPLITCIVGKFIIHIYPLIMLPKVILVTTCHSLSLYIYSSEATMPICKPTWTLQVPSNMVVYPGI